MGRRLKSHLVGWHDSESVEAIVKDMLNHAALTRKQPNML